MTILVLYGAGRRRSSVWPSTLLRVVAAAGMVIPGMTIIGWLRQLQRAREWSRNLPVSNEPVAEMFLVRSAALLSAGFLILVSGIYLARRLPGGRPASGAGRRPRS